MGKTENKKNGIVDEALLDIKRIQEALNSNSKEILRSVAREEIESIVKESLNEQEDIEDDDTDLDMEDDVEDMEDDMEDEDMEDDMEDEDMDMDMDIEDDEMEDEDDVIDMRGSSEHELLKVFKAMGDEDGIIVSKDGGDISLTDDDNFSASCFNTSAFPFMTNTNPLRTEVTFKGV